MIYQAYKWSNNAVLTPSRNGLVTSYANALLTGYFASVNL